METLPNEIFYKILDFLDLKSLKKLSLTNLKIFDKIQKYVVSITFVNHRLQQNTIFKMEFSFFLQNVTKLVNLLKYVINNDFIHLEFEEKVFINIVSGIDIEGYAVFEYYCSYLQGLNYYIFPELDLEHLKQFQRLHIKNLYWQPNYEVYYEDYLKLEDRIKKFIIPKKEYQDIIYFNDIENKINSYLV